MAVVASSRQAPDPASGTAGIAASIQGRRALAVMPDNRRRAMLAESRTGGQEAHMERADWLEGGFDSAQARFLMVTAITHHRFSSPAWGEHEIRSHHTELTE